MVACSFFCRNNVVPNKRKISVDNVCILNHKELRKKTGLSQSKFSAKFGIPVRTLQQWEQGISVPPEYLIRMMAYIMQLEENGQKQDEEPIRGERADGK